MGGSFGVNVDNRAKLSLPTPGSAVMIKVNMGREQLPNLLRRQPALAEFGHHIFKNIGWAAVDHDKVAWCGFDDCDANNLRSV